MGGGEKAHGEAALGKNRPPATGARWLMNFQDVQKGNPASNAGADRGTSYQTWSRGHADISKRGAGPRRDTQTVFPTYDTGVADVTDVKLTTAELHKKMRPNALEITLDPPRIT